MIRRSLSVGLAILAVGLMVATAHADDTPPPAKAKPRHGLGKFVSYDKDAKKLVVSHKKDGEKTLDLADKVKVLIDGTEGEVETLSKLTKGDRVFYKFGDDGKVVEVRKEKGRGPGGPAPATPAPAPAPAPAPSPAPAPTPPPK